MTSRRSASGVVSELLIMVETIGRRGVRLANRLEGLGLRVIGESLTASGASTGPLVVLGEGCNC